MLLSRRIRPHSVPVRLSDSWITFIIKDEGEHPPVAAHGGKKNPKTVKQIVRITNITEFVKMGSCFRVHVMFLSWDERAKRLQ